MKKLTHLSKLASMTVLASCLGASLANAASTEIRYGVWDRNQLPTVEKLVQRFEKQNPDIDVIVELTPYKQYFVKLDAAATGGVAPDVFWMNMPNAEKYVKNGLIEPLDAKIAKDGVDLSGYSASAVKAYNFDGKQYALPRDVDSIAVWYNKDLFDKAGVAYPTNQWTWKDMKAKARALHNKLGDDVYPVMMDLTIGQTSYFNLFMQIGNTMVSKDGKKTDVGNKASIAVLEDIQSMMAENLLPNGQRLSGLKGDQVFQSNKAGMYYAGSWMAGPFSRNELINDHIGVVEMPAINNKGGVSHGLGYAMSAKSEHKDASWKLVKFLNSKESQEELAAGGVVIPANLEAGQMWAKSFKNVDVSPYVSSLKFASPYPVAGNTAKWHSILNDGLKKVWQGKSPEKVMPSVTKRIEKTLSRG